MIFSTQDVPEYLTKESVLSKIPEIEIFRHYLNLPYLSESDYFCNTVRQDNSPTCTFFRNREGRLIMSDWAGYFRGDCISLVMWCLNLSYVEALKEIWCTLGHIDFEKDLLKEKRKAKQIRSTQTRNITIIVEKEPWTEESIKYWWKKYGISESTLNKYRVCAIRTLWKHGSSSSNVKYRWNAEFPVFGYYFGKGIWKIYYPKIKHRAKSFISNGPHVQGLEQLPSDFELNYLVITKSLKDVMILNQLGIPAIAPSAESTMIPEEVMDRFLHRIPIFTLYDNDVAGREGSKKMREKYFTLPMFLDPKKVGDDVKDISDLAEKLKNKKQLKEKVYEGDIFTNSDDRTIRGLWREKLYYGSGFYESGNPF